MTQDQKCFYTEEETQIFKYFNGVKNCFIDPYDVQLRIFSQCEDFELLAKGAEDFEMLQDVPDLKHKIPDAAQAMMKLIALIKDVFKVPELDVDDNGKVTGLTTNQVIELMMNFTKFIDDVKKKQEGIANLSPPMELPVS